MVSLLKHTFKSTCCAL